MTQHTQVLAAMLTFLLLPAVVADELSEQLQVIRQVKTGAGGSRQAAAAWKQVAASNAEQLETILAAIDSTKPVAANWLRSAVDTIAERTLANGEPLPVERLERFALSTEFDGRARRLAFEWLRRADAAAAERLIPGLLHDPNIEFRRDAVERLMEAGNRLLDASDKAAAIKTFEEALSGARDPDQINAIVKQLRGLEQEVNLPRHFGFLLDWQIIGPFDNGGLAGFAKEYPPEQEYAPGATYKGKADKVRWESYSTDDDFGMVDFNRPLGSLKEVVAYAKTDFVSDRAQDVEIRLGCKNAWKVWLNGELLFGRDEYHRGIQIDQYRMPAKLRAGSNEILIKVCQNELTESWTVEWQFQLRVCDSAGTAILSADRDAQAAR